MFVREEVNKPAYTRERLVVIPLLDPITEKQYTGIVININRTIRVPVKADQV